MVGLDGVDDVLFFLVLAAELHTKLDVGALHLVVNGLADIVQQTRTLGGGHIGAQLRRHHAGDMGHLDGVLQHILAVAGAVMQAAQQLLQLRMHASHAGFQSSTLALGADDSVHLPAGLLHHFLNVGGMDTAVGNELLQRQAGHLAAHRLEAGHGDGLRRIVDDQIGTGERLQCADVAALAADDTALHLVIGQGNHADGNLSHMVRGTALDGSGHDLTGTLVGLVLGTGLDLLDLHGGFVSDLRLHLPDQIFLGLLGCEAGNALQHLGLAALDELDLILFSEEGFVLLGQSLLLFLDGIGLAVDVLFLLLQTAFLLLQVRSALLNFLLVFRTVSQDLFLRLQQSLALLALGAFDRLVDDAPGLILSAGNFLFRYLFAVLNADKEANQQRNNSRNSRYNVANCGHDWSTSCKCV